MIGEATLPDELAGVEAFPVGWLPGQQLLVAANADGCDRPVGLWVVDVVPGGPASATLLVTDVDRAAIRAVVPDPPPPLGDVSVDDFA